MNKKVREILSKYRQNESYTMEHAERELLDLFSVSQQREPLSCDCPKCGKEMISEWVKHHHCNKCKEHYTST